MELDSHSSEAGQDATTASETGVNLEQKTKSENIRRRGIVSSEAVKSLIWEEVFLNNPHHRLIRDEAIRIMNINNNNSHTKTMKKA